MTRRYLIAALLGILPVWAQTATLPIQATASADAFPLKARIVISAPAIPCTLEEQAELERKLNGKDKSGAYILIEPCPHWTGEMMAEIEGDKVTIKPGFTAEQVILHLIELYKQDTQQLSKSHQDQTTEIASAFREYQKAVEKQLGLYKALIAEIQKALKPTPPKEGK